MQSSPVAMDRSLVGFHVNEEVGRYREQLRAAGYEMCCAPDGDLSELVRFASSLFSPDWGQAIREGVLGGRERASSA